MSKINSFTIWSFTMYHLVERAVAPAFLFMTHCWRLLPIAPSGFKLFVMLVCCFVTSYPRRSRPLTLSQINQRYTKRRHATKVTHRHGVISPVFRLANVLYLLTSRPFVWGGGKSNYLISCWLHGSYRVKSIHHLLR